MELKSSDSERETPGLPASASELATIALHRPSERGPAPPGLVPQGAVRRMTGSHSFLVNGGEMGSLMRAHDWSTSPLGAPSAWPQSLRTAVNLMIDSKHPMFIAWGPDLAFLFNDGYLPILGAKHPHTIGLPFRQVWPEVWDDLWPLIERAGVRTPGPPAECPDA